MKNGVKRIINNTVCTVLLVSVLSGCGIVTPADHSSAGKLRGNKNSYSSVSSKATKQTDAKIKTTLDFEVYDREEPLEIEKIVMSDRFGYNYIYDVEYYGMAFGDGAITMDMFNSVIEDNNGISDYFKGFIKDYVKCFFKEYPDADRRILYNNLKTLEVVECKDKLELLTHTLSSDSFACYVKSENKIYTLLGYNYVPGTWDYQVIMHEFSHAARSYWRDNNGDGSFDIKVQFEGLGIKPLSVAEAMNSIFAVRLYDKTERDIAYQLQSNYFSILLKSVDNYKLDDYVNHSMTYLASKLDEAGGYNNYSMTIFELMDAQYDDYHSDLICIPEENFYPIYDYVSDYYYGKNLKKGMTDAEMTATCTRLVEAVTFDVPEEYHIDKDHFYVHLKEYIKTHDL